MSPTEPLSHILMGRHAVRTDPGREWGATDVVAERGDEGIAAVRELTGGDGLRPAYDMSVGFGGLFGKNITLTGGPAPVRAYIEQLLPEVLDGRLEPGKVFDRTVSLDHTAAGYRAMDERTALKVMVTP